MIEVGDALPRMWSQRLQRKDPKPSNGVALNMAMIGEGNLRL